MHVDGPADLFHVGLHDIHTHAAPGNVRYFFGSGKTWKKDQVKNVAVLHARSLFGGDNTAFNRLPPDAVEIESGSVVRDFDVDLPAFVEGPQH